MESVKHGDVTQTESFSLNSERSLQSNTGCSEVTDRRDCSSAEDAGDCSVLDRCSAGRIDEASCCTICVDHDVIPASRDDDDDVGCTEDGNMTAVSTTSEKNVDVSSMQKDADELDIRSCDYMMSAHHVDSMHTVDEPESHAVVDEQEANCETTPATRDRFTEHAFVNPASRQSAALVSQLYLHSEMEDAANALTTDWCQYVELQQLCRHLQVTAEMYMFCTPRSHVYARCVVAQR